MTSDKNAHRLNFTKRRIRYGLATLVLLALLSLVAYAQDQSLQHSSFTTGYVLIGCLLFLAAFNVRKKLSFLPAIGSASFWMQLHIYVGLATFAIFGIHIAWHVPNGWFESLLAILYLSVACSGVYGLYATRVYPSRLTGLHSEVIFERIPVFRQQIANQARMLVLHACENSDVLANFYTNRLAGFLERPRSLAYLVRPTGRVRRQLLLEIKDLDRYLGNEQRNVSNQLAAMVRQRDDLDYHFALQGRLKVWMFVHIGLTYSLLAVAILHMVIVHAFRGGLS